MVVPEERLKMKFYTKFNPPPSEATKIDSLSMTCQEFKAECDINNIVKKPNYGINPLQPPTRTYEYGDYTAIQYQDFHSAQNIIAEASQLFESLDSEVRARFDNDPGKLLSFVEDPRNYDEGVKLGLFEYDVDIANSLSKQQSTNEVVSPVETPATSSVGE